MKIMVKDLVSNPYRQMEKYPIDRAKVEALKTSIKDTGFWDNLLVRKKNGKYQIAYGHHRLLAIRELGIEKIEAPVRDLEDAAMLRIMAEENIEWSTSPAVINETVLAVKMFLDGELAKHETWEQVRSNKFITTLFGNAGNFGRAKKEGVGQKIILKFLGGNWKQWMVQEALNTLKDKSIDRKAVESLPTLLQARTFKKAVKDYKIPKAKQKAIAEKITKEPVGSTEIRKAIRQESPVPEALKKDPALAKLERLVLDIDKQARTLRNKIMAIRREIEQLNVKEVKGIKVLLAKSSLHLLFEEMKRLERKE